MIAEFTQPLRHAIVRLIAPKIYNKRTWIEEHRAVPRPMIKEVKRFFGKRSLVGVEIGVAKGKNSESILIELNMKKLYLVDPYIPYWQHETMESRFVTHYVDDSSEALERLKPYEDKYVLLRMDSNQAVNEIPDNLDFVYVDGDHNYDQVKKDLQNFYPKVRKGGIIGGHDFYIRDHVGLIKAVIEFTNEEGVKLTGDLSDYWIIKET